mgnify:FL=1
MKYLVANWKMNLINSKNWIYDFNNNLNDLNLNDDLRIVICPNYLQLPKFIQNHLSKINFSMGAQNVSGNNSGAFTGEISVEHLTEFSEVSYCIVGHSERRSAGETDAMIKAKVKQLLTKNITPIICIGESHEIQEKGETEKFLNSQLSSIVNDENLNIDSCILAYEPLWAIGKGVPADLETINNSISYITKIIDLNKSNLKILYGGSVDSENSGEILSVDNVSGLLVGNSSLDGKEFANIAKKF